MVDYTKRDAKVTQKLEELRATPPDQYDLRLAKALRALFNLGLETARAEAGWCYDCQGKGYFTRWESGVPFGLHVSPPPRGNDVTRVCGCKRGHELRQLLGDKEVLASKPPPGFKVVKVEGFWIKQKENDED